MVDLCSLTSQEISVCMWQKEAFAFSPLWACSPFLGICPLLSTALGMTGQIQIPAMSVPSLAEPHDKLITELKSK